MSNCIDYVNWQFCWDLHDVNRAIETGNEEWYGLKTTDQIINIIKEDTGRYMVIWRVREIEE